jgi:hypothetical protein
MLSETALASGNRGEREEAFASVTVARVSDVLSPTVGSSDIVGVLMDDDD